MKLERIEYKKGGKVISTDIIKVIFDNDNEWKEHRADGIGGSEDGTLLGLNKYDTPLQWYRRKKGLIPQAEMNDAMLRGHCLEDGVAKFFSAKTGLTILDNTADNIVYYREDAPHRRVTPDRIGLLNGTKSNSLDPSKRFVLECKTHRGVIPFNEEDGHFDYPKMWRVQVMKALGILDMKVGYIAWVDSSLDMNYEKIEFCQKEYDSICKVEDSYWELFINDIEPDAENTKDIEIKFPKESVGKCVELNGEQQSILERIAEYNKEIKEYTDKAEELKGQLKMFLEDAESAIDPAGVTLCTYKASMKFNEEELKDSDPKLYDKYLVKTFDKDAFKKAEGNSTYRKYCTSVGSRTLRIK